MTQGNGAAKDGLTLGSTRWPVVCSNCMVPMTSPSAQVELALMIGASIARLTPRSIRRLFKSLNR